MTLQFNAGAGARQGDTLFFYYNNEAAGTYEYYGQVTVGANGMVEIPFQHASELCTDKKDDSKGC